MPGKRLRKSRVFYNNLRIRSKILMILGSIILLFFAVSVIVMKLTFGIYSAVLYEQASKSLNLTTTNIEHDLQNVDTVSYAIVSDSNVQQYVETIKDSDDAMDVATSTTSLIGQLSTYATNQPYISSINFIDTHDSQSTTGLMDSWISSSYLTQVQQKASQANGSSVFLDPMGSDSSVYLTRIIREVPGLRLDNMGTLVIRCNITKIVANYLSVTRGNSSTLAIFDGKNRIYRSSRLSVSDSEIVGIRPDSSYIIKKIDGRKYFLVVDHSEYTGWKYIYLIPYDTIFHQILMVQWAEFIILAFAFLLVILLGVWFAFDLTRPLEKLTAEIKLVETGNFHLPHDPASHEKRLDEIGTLQNDFELMTQKIDDLINENYVKQLVIKDTQMKALQAQINPHFLYNTLESINWMAKVNGQSSISLMAESLGNLLRGALKVKEKTIRIDDELALLQNYINIQKIRYEERLNFQLLIDDSLRKYRIPQLTLQPIVENAIAYGLESMSGVCTITIRFVSIDETIHILIEDNGPGIESELLRQINDGIFQPRGFGIGLKNISDRLKLVFGEEYGITVYSQPGVGTRVSIFIPKQT